MTRTHKLMVVAAFLGGIILAHALPVVYAQTGVKAPKWSHGLNLRVRKADEKDFNDQTKRIGIEVFKDDNNGNLIYITEAGAIAVVPGK